jgi:subtilisin-like proprotein convertase family protein
LRNFIGEQGMGVWLLTMADNVPGHTGLVENLTIRLDPQNVANAAQRDVLTNAFSFDFLDVPSARRTSPSAFTTTPPRPCP